MSESELSMALLLIVRCFSNKDVALEWLKEPQTLLKNKSPLMQMAEGNINQVLWLAQSQGAQAYSSE